MYTTGDSIHFVSFVISGFTTDTKKYIFFSLLYSASQLFL